MSRTGRGFVSMRSSYCIRRALVEMIRWHSHRRRAARKKKAVKTEKRAVFINRYFEINKRKYGELVMESRMIMVIRDILMQKIWSI